MKLKLKQDHPDYIKVHYTKKNMETHLTINYLAPYLPYKLKYQLYGNFPIEKGIDNWIYDIREISPFDFTLKKVLKNKTCKPILHPLSDLTKEIEVNGERFVPVEILYEGTMLEWQRDVETHGVFYDYVKEMHEHDLITELTYNQVEKLFEWKFNVFGLPEELYIDVNKLPDNPYK